VPAAPPLLRGGLLRVTSTTAIGRGGEERARRFYAAQGYEIVAANIRLARVEVDLIVRRDAELLFVEVKCKRGEEYGDPLEMVDGRKLQRLRRAAEVWLATHSGDRAGDVAIEVLALRPGGIERVRDVG
jgi:putative endonuclease